MMTKEQMARVGEIMGNTELPPETEIEILTDKIWEDPGFDLDTKIWGGVTNGELLEILFAARYRIEELECDVANAEEKVEKLEKVLWMDFGVHPSEVY